MDVPDHPDCGHWGNCGGVDFDSPNLFTTHNNYGDHSGVDSNVPDYADYGNHSGVDLTSPTTTTATTAAPTTATTTTARAEASAATTATTTTTAGCKFDGGRATSTFAGTGR